MAIFYLIGYVVNGKFSGYELWSLHPFIWSVAVSAVVMLVMGRCSQPPEKELIEKYFGKPMESS